VATRKRDFVARSLIVFFLTYANNDWGEFQEDKDSLSGFENDINMWT